MNLSRRKVLGGITTVGAASAAAGAGTFALFSSSETNEVGTISTGTVQLGTDSTETAAFNMQNAGSSANVSGDVELSYSGSLNANLYLGIRFSEGSEILTETLTNEKTATQVAKKLYLNDASTIKIERGTQEHVDEVINTNDQTTGMGFTDLGSSSTIETLYDLKTEIPIQSGDPSRLYGTVEGGETITVTIDADLQKSDGDPVGNPFQDESIQIELVAYAEEDTTTTTT